MALTVTKSPGDFEMSKNPIPMVLQSDEIVMSAGAPMSFQITLNNFDVGVEPIVVIKLNEYSLTFQVKETPDSSGYQLPWNHGDTLPEVEAQWEAMAAALEANYYINKDFDVTLNGSPYYTDITLTANRNDLRLIAIIISDTYGWLFEQLAYGSDTVYQPNAKMKAAVLFESETETTLALNPDSAYKCTFELENILNSLLSYVLPNYDGEIIETLVGTWGYYYLLYYIEYGSPPNGYHFTSTGPFKVLKAGIAKHQLSTTSNTIDDYTTTPAKFLTNQSRSKKVSFEQKEWLSFFFDKASYSVDELGVHVDIVYLDGTTDDIFINIATTVEDDLAMYTAPVGFTQLGLDVLHEVNPIKSYSVFVEMHHTDTEIEHLIVTETMSYTVDYDIYKAEKHLYFFGSMSGLDTFRATGVVEEGFEIEKETVQSTRVFGSLYSHSQFSNVNHDKKDTFTIHTGWLTKVEMDYLQELFLAEYAYIDAYNGFAPIVIMNKKEYKYDSDTGKSAYAIECYLSNTNNVGAQL